MWHTKTFDELTTREFYDISFERGRVFVVEQKSAFQDVDEIDLKAVHVYKIDDDKLQAYIRIYEKNDGDTSFGRVLVPKEFRRKGLGKELLTTALQYMNENYPEQDISIEAASYLTDFYKSFGFEINGEEYLDTDIWHYPMKLVRK